MRSSNTGGCSQSILVCVYISRNAIETSMASQSFIGVFRPKPTNVATIVTCRPCTCSKARCNVSSIRLYSSLSLVLSISVNLLRIWGITRPNAPTSSGLSVPAPCPIVIT